MSIANKVRLIIIMIIFLICFNIGMSIRSYNIKDKERREASRILNGQLDNSEEYTDENTVIFIDQLINNSYERLERLESDVMPSGKEIVKMINDINSDGGKLVRMSIHLKDKKLNRLIILAQETNTNINVWTNAVYHSINKKDKRYVYEGVKYKDKANELLNELKIERGKF